MAEKRRELAFIKSSRLPVLEIQRQKWHLKLMTEEESSAMCLVKRQFKPCGAMQTQIRCLVS